MIKPLQLSLNPFNQFQLFLTLGQLFSQRRLLLLQQYRNDILGIFLSEQGRNAFDGKSDLSQKTDDAHPLYVVLCVESATAFTQLAGYQDASVIVVLHRSYRDSAELCDFSRRVF